MSIAIIIICCSTAAYAQKTAHAVSAITYTNQTYHFSFSIPSYIKIRPSSDRSYYNFIAGTPFSKRKYRQAKGYVFTMQVFTTPLDSTLSLQDYEKHSDGDYYIHTRLDDSLKTKKIKGIGWTGLHDTHVCRGGSKFESNGDVTSEILDGCENIYFSNGRITVKIYTDGYKLDDQLYNQILKSFRFNSFK